MGYQPFYAWVDKRDYAKVKKQADKYNEESRGDALGQGNWQSAWNRAARENKFSKPLYRNLGNSL